MRGFIAAPAGDDTGAHGTRIVAGPEHADRAGGADAASWVTQSLDNGDRRPAGPTIKSRFAIGLLSFPLPRLPEPEGEIGCVP